MAEPLAPALPSELPVVPLRGAVVLPLSVSPLGVQPLDVGRGREPRARGRSDDPDAAPDERHGRAGSRRSAQGRDGRASSVRWPRRRPACACSSKGIARARAEFLQVERGVLQALVKPLKEPADRTVGVDARVRHLQELVDRALSLATGLSPDIKALVTSMDDPLRIAYLLASLLDMKPEDKQKLLEENDLEVKLDAVAMALSREIEILELKGRIESRAEKEMTDAQRQYVLRQQLKAIQSELGEGDSDVQEIRTRVTDAHLPERVETAALREVDRLERMTPASPEYQMLRTYIDWVLDIPWDKPTEDRLDPIEARRVLDEDHYDLDKVKERIVEYLAVQKLRQRSLEAPAISEAGGTAPAATAARMKGPILCFVGPPGVGKTSLGQSIARAMNRKFVRISLGGVRDEAEIRGHRRTYIGSMPGRLAQALKSAGSSNPVLMLDEIDKISVGIQGDPAAALLEVLDPAQNHAFRDHYLEIPIDLSRVLFIATANQLGTVHPALLDRMEMISLSGYTEDEKVHIARKYLVPRQLEEHGLHAGQIEFTDEALRRVIGEYTREAGVRTLERQIGAIARKVAARVATDPVHTARVDADQVHDYLGQPRVRPETPFRTSRPGVATGLAWTETGGDVLYIEAALLPGGSGQVILTGSARQRHAGIGARRPVAHQTERSRPRHRAGVPQQAGHPHPRAGRRHSQGRPVGGRDDGDRDGLGGARRAGALRCRDDRRDYAVGSRAAGRRHPREDARRTPNRHQDHHPAGHERAGPERAARGCAEGHDVPSRAHAR